jgi:hypothetical protein
LFDQDATSTPGEVSWNNFVHALVSSGKFAEEKLHGLASQFTGVDGVEQSSVLFHKPHPGSKLPFVIARLYSRRLNRRYGRERGIFELK